MCQVIKVDNSFTHSDLSSLSFIIDVQFSKAIVMGGCTLLESRTNVTSTQIIQKAHKSPFHRTLMDKRIEALSRLIEMNANW